MTLFILNHLKHDLDNFIAILPRIRYNLKMNGIVEKILPLVKRKRLI